MTTPVGGTGSGAYDEVLAGEYVLGALPPETARQVEARLKTDRQFAAIVRRWQDNLSDPDEAEADPWLLAGHTRLSGPPVAADFVMPSRGVWQSFAFWRGFGIAALGLLAIYAVFEARNAGRSADTAAPALTAIYDPAAGRITVDVTPATSPELKIWLIEEMGQAHLLGEMPATGTMTLDADMQQRLAEGASLAVSPAD